MLTRRCGTIAALGHIIAYLSKAGVEIFPSHCVSKSRPSGHSVPIEQAWREWGLTRPLYLEICLCKRQISKDCVTEIKERPPSVEEQHGVKVKAKVEWCTWFSTTERMWHDVVQLSRYVSVEVVFIRDQCLLSTKQQLVNRGFKRCFKCKRWCQLTQISLCVTITARRKADILQPVSPDQSMLGCVTQLRALALSRRPSPPELHLQETSSLFTGVTAD